MSDAAAHKLWRANLVSGEVTLVASNLGFGGFYRAHGIAVDADGFVIGMHHDPGQILRVDPATGEQTLVASGGDLKYLTEIEIDRDGSLLVSDLFDGVIVRVDPTTGAQQTIDVPYIITGLALVPYPRCSNGLDDDGDGAIDFDGGALAGLPPARRTSPDSQCIVNGVGDPLHDREEPPPIACGLGWEVAPFVALVRAAFRRRRRAT
jgi:sugar lactone lactonase YvrE